MVSKDVVFNLEIFMRRIQSIAATALAAAVLSPASAQTATGTANDSDIVHLTGRHMISVSVGFMDHTSSGVSVTFGGVSVNSGGTVWVGYGHWFEPDWALLAETGVVSSQVEVSATGTETAMLFPILFGLRYQPENWALGEKVRPYLGVSAGPYFGFQTVAGWSVEVGTQTAIGGRFSGGLDVVLGRHVSLGTAVQYHAVTDFDRPIGSRDNYSGFEFSLRLGILLGRGR
jgi:outer membrane protein W